MGMKIHFNGIIIGFLTTQLIPCDMQHALGHSFFEKVQIQGTYLELYDDQYQAAVSGMCALECMSRREATTPCQAFTHNPVDGTCHFYRKGSSISNDATLQVLQFKITDMFQDVRIGSKRYSILLSSQKKPYHEARDQCNSLGGYLLEIDSLDKYDAMGMISAGHSELVSFIGVNDIQVENQWVTDRDSTPIDWAFLVWGMGFPDNYGGDEDCAVIHSDAPFLGDLGCSDHLTFFCERNVVQA